MTDRLKPKSRPFKKFYCDRDEVFLLPPNAFKIWMFYYRLEPAKREGWASRETICDKCGVSLETLKTVKAWLIKHGWLKQIRTHETRGGGLIPVMQVTRGQIPAKTDGRGKSKKSSTTQFKKRRKVSTPPSGGELTPPPPAENLVEPQRKVSTTGGEQVFPHNVDNTKSIDKTPVDKKAGHFESRAGKKVWIEGVTQ